MENFDLDRDIKKYNMSFATYYKQVIIIPIVAALLLIVFDVLAFQKLIADVDGMSILIISTFLVFSIYAIVNNIMAFKLVKARYTYLNELYDLKEYEKAHGVLGQKVSNKIRSINLQYVPSLRKQQILLEYYYFKDNKKATDTFLMLGQKEITKDKLFTELANELKVDFSLSLPEQNYNEEVEARQKELKQDISEFVEDHKEKIDIITDNSKIITSVVALVIMTFILGLPAVFFVVSSVIDLITNGFNYVFSINDVYILFALYVPLVIVIVYLVKNIKRLKSKK
ncbi:MAG: hypothetical protein AB7S44_03875 [Spirochaetales bacterium]